MEGKNLRTGKETHLLTAHFTTELGKLLSLGRNKGLFYWMNRPAKQNKIPPKIEKPKGPVTLVRTNFIGEILKRMES